MVKEIDLMFKEAFEELKPYWEPKDGDQFYVEYSEADKQFSKEHYPDKEDHNGFWYIEHLIEFQSINGNGERYIEHLRNKVINWRARQEDLQRIYMKIKDEAPGDVLNQFYQFHLDKEEKKEVLPTILDFNNVITMYWFVFVMETCFQKQWNGKTWVGFE